MEPLKINIEVSFSDTTCALIKSIAQFVTATAAAALNPDLLSKANQQPEQAAEPQPQPSTQEAAAPAPDEAPIENITLFNAVKAAKDRGIAPQTIKEVFAEFGISTSRDCPMDRRHELLERINAL